MTLNCSKLVKNPHYDTGLKYVIGKVPYKFGSSVNLCRYKQDTDEGLHAANGLTISRKIMMIIKKNNNEKS